MSECLFFPVLHPFGLDCALADCAIASAKSQIELYLERIIMCTKQVDVITSFFSFSSVKFNHEHCKYLAHKLKLAVRNAHLFFEQIKTWYPMCALPEDMAQSLEIFKLLSALSKLRASSKGVAKRSGFNLPLCWKMCRKTSRQ